MKETVPASQPEPKIDPVMQKYMAMVLEKKKQQENEAANVNY